jgi:hypothetical protein
LGLGDLAIIIGSSFYAISAVVIKNAIDDNQAGFRLFVRRTMNTGSSR